MDIVLKKDSEEPIYNQIYSQIVSQILNHTLDSGSRLPPIRTIANELRISVIPVKMAWEALDKDGYIYTASGRGTFVSDLDHSSIEDKKQKEARLLAEQTCRRVKEIGLSKDDFINLIKEVF